MHIRRSKNKYIRGNMFFVWVGLFCLELLLFVSSCMRGKKKSAEQIYFPIGYLMFFLLSALKANDVEVGRWMLLAYIPFFLGFRRLLNREMTRPEGPRKEYATVLAVFFIGICIVCGVTIF